MRATVLFLALLSGCSAITRDPEPNVRMGGALSEEDEKYREQYRATAAEAESGNALSNVAGDKFDHWQVSPRFDHPAPESATSSASPSAR